MRARDNDLGDNGKVDYAISSSSGDVGVIIDGNGYIVATRSFDHERNHQLSFEVTARDRGQPPKRATCTVILTIKVIFFSNLSNEMSNVEYYF